MRAASEIQPVESLNALIVEDSDVDVELLVRFLRKEQFDLSYERVDTAEALRNALSKRDWDLIISDYWMSGFSGLEAFHILQETRKDIPFLIVSGSIGEETAVDIMRAGIQDYIMKDNLHRLAPAIKRELREARGRDERRKAETALAEERKHVESEREHMLAMEHSALEMALQATKLKDEFLANMSHEIRTPLNGMIGVLDLLMESAPTEEQSTLLSTAKECGGSLLEIVNRILDFSRLEAGEVRSSSRIFSPHGLVDAIVRSFSTPARAKNISLMMKASSDVPERARGDSNRMAQVLKNLLSNALKFTEFGEIVVRLDFQAHTGMRCSVRDTGIGIPKASQIYLFQPFTQVDGSMTRNYGGTGLGLSISKRLVEQMGGEIGFESDEGRGSTFWFTVPLEKP